MLQSLEAKTQERQWLRNQTTGDLDDNRLVDGTLFCVLVRVCVV